MRQSAGSTFAKALVLSFGLIVPCVDVAGISVAAAESVHPMAQIVRSAESIRRLDFTVIRGGEEIGRHVIDFNRDGDLLEVNARTQIEVKAAFLTVYRFEHKSRETWRNGKLISLDARTNDNGDIHVVSARTVSGRFEIAGSGERLLAPDDVVPESLWSAAFLNRKTVMSPLDGSQSGFDVRSAGTEWIDCGGRELPARHYVVSGSRVEQLWFDENDMLARMRIRARDSSVIDFVLRSPTANKLIGAFRSAPPIIPARTASTDRG